MNLYNLNGAFQRTLRFFKHGDTRPFLDTDLHSFSFNLSRVYQC